jgi:hypothetical protein
MRSISSPATREYPARTTPRQRADAAPVAVLSRFADRYPPISSGAIISA